MAHINRALGQGDSPNFTADTTAAVKALQERAGRAPTGVVEGVDWVLFMPRYQLGNLGPELRVVRKHLGLPESHWFDEELATALGGEVLDQEAWAKLAGLTLSPVPDAVAEPAPETLEPEAPETAEAPQDPHAGVPVVLTGQEAAQ